MLNGKNKSNTLESMTTNITRIKYMKITNSVNNLIMYNWFYMIKSLGSKRHLGL